MATADPSQRGLAVPPEGRSGYTTLNKDAERGEKDFQEEVVFNDAWDLPIPENIYAMMVVTPAAAVGGAQRTMAIFSSIFLLVMNGVLQLMVVQKVSAMTQHDIRETLGTIFFEYGGNCAKLHDGDMPFKHLLHESSETLYDCQSATVTLLSNVSALDLDGDGFWTEKEAEAIGDRWHKKYHKAITAVESYRSLLKMAREGHLLAQEAAEEEEDAKKSWKNATNEFSAMPMNWMKLEQGRLDLCTVTERQLCANLELRGILSEKLADSKSESRNSRVLECRRLIDSYCPRVFGMVWEAYKDYTSQACGAASMSWSSKVELNVAQFATANKYRSSQGIMSGVYASFLGLILIIWWLSMVEELRKVMNWWVCISLIPSQETEELPDLVITDDGIQINSIPLWHKFLIVTLSMLPRTAIAVWLTFVGTDWLIYSDDYGDLILNSVALGFLINVDEMLFNAVCSQQTRQEIQNCQPLKVRNHCFQYITQMQKLHLTSMATAVAILALGWAYVQTSYNMGTGKNSIGEALACLCQTEGYDCVSAQLLGGNPFLK